MRSGREGRAEQRSPGALFDLETVFDVDDYLFAYGSELTGERAQAEVDQWAGFLELDAPMRILDLACGFGRHANRLAALGHTVTGVDIMPGFLEIARREAGRMGVRVDYRQGDMRQIEFLEEFDRVLLLFTSFGYFEDSENLEVLSRAGRALRPGGLLGLDSLNGDAFANVPPSHEVIERGPDLLINRLSYDPDTRRLLNRRILVRNGIRKDKPFAVRLYSPAEIRDLVREAGLETYRLMGGEGQALTPDARRLAVVARKPA